MSAVHVIINLNNLKLNNLKQYHSIGTQNIAVSCCVARPHAVTRERAPLPAHLLLGIWGSLMFHADVWDLRVAALIRLTSSEYAPPHTMGLPLMPIVHSAALPSRS